MLHTPRWADAQFIARILHTLRAREADEQGSSYGAGVSAIDVAREEGAPIALVAELLEGAEMSEDASLVRDEGAPGGTRWFPNLFATAAL